MAGAQIGNPKPQFFDASGNPLVGGTLTVYLAGTTTPTNTWQDRAQTTLNTNPITLDARGECSLWLDNALTYKFVLKNALGVEQWTYDNIVGSVAGAASAVTFLQAGTGAISRTAQNKMREVFSVADFGAVGDGVTDDAPAFRTCLAAIGYKAAIVLVPRPASFYRFADQVEVTAPVTFQGQGIEPNTSTLGTWIKVDAGKTAFCGTRKSTGVADGWGLRDLSISTAGANTNETTANYVYSGYNITLASASDFQNGDIILIRGGGLSCPLNRSEYFYGSTTAGSPTVTLNRKTGTYLGMHLQVAGAGIPASAYITAISGDGLTITMSQNAANTVSNAALSYNEDFAAVINSGGGTTTLTLNVFPTNTAGFTGHKVIHFPCAVFSEAPIISHNLSTHGFTRGAGVLLLANATINNKYGQSPNCNQSVFTGKLRTFSNQVGLRLQGNDANNCQFDIVDGYGNSEFCLDDNSFLGNNFKGGHVSGNFGYRTTNLNALSTFFGCYSEGGTRNVFAQATLRVGGFMGGAEANIFGGMAFGHETGVASIPPSRLYPQGANLQASIADHNLSSGIIFINNSARGGSSNLCFLRYSSVAADGVAGVLGVYDAASSVWAWGFTDASHTRGAGLNVAPRGLLLGSGGALSDPHRKIVYGTAAPVSGTWVQSDIVLNTIATAGGFVGWVCTAGGTPGTWKTFGAISP